MLLAAAVDGVIQLSLIADEFAVGVAEDPGDRVGLSVRVTELGRGLVHELAGDGGVESRPIGLVRLGLEVVLGALLEVGEALGHLLPVGDRLAELLEGAVTERVEVHQFRPLRWSKPSSRVEMPLMESAM